MNEHLGKAHKKCVEEEFLENEKLQKEFLKVFMKEYLEEFLN